jgi:transposase
MRKRPRSLRSQQQIIGDLSVVNPNAAGIDAGSEGHLVSVREDRTDEPVRAFTEDLHKLAAWLILCGVTTVAIEATGVYWIPLFEILEQYGLNPRLVDSRAIGRRNKKTDVLDCQRIRQLHMYGLLDAAFRPSAEILPLRAFNRQRQMLIEYAADHIRHMQKALDLMNIKLHLVLSDIVGVSGLRIIHAILDGKRDAKSLAELRDPSCQGSEAAFIKALTGNWRPEHLFALKQAVTLFETYQRLIAECDRERLKVLEAFEKVGDPEKLPRKAAKKRRKNQPYFDGRTILYQINGIDLTAVPSLQVSGVLTILGETGTDMSRWPDAPHFTSWLGLSCNNRLTGGKPIPNKRFVQRPNRAAQAFRLAAQTLERSQCALGAFFRRIQSRLGRAGAIKATAAKLATIFYTMLQNKTEYSEPGVDYYETRYRQRLLKSLEKKAATLGYTLAPVQEVH